MRSRSGCPIFVLAVVLIAAVLAPAAADAVAVASTGAATSTPGAAQGGATTVERVSPLDHQGHLRTPYTVTTTRPGHCWTASFVNGRLYRCLSGNYILDPCWKEAGRASVVCLGLPWSAKVVRLRLTRTLPATDSHGPGIWGLRLGGGVGANCLVSTGAGGAVGHHPISYFCTRGWVLLGQGPSRSRPLWTMLAAQRVDGRYELRGRQPLPVAWQAVVL